MKIVLLILVSLGVGVAMAQMPSTKSGAGKEEVGRYQLLQIRVDTGASTTINTVCKIDTVTGTAWYYAEVTTGNSVMAGWVDIPEKAQVMQLGK